MQTVFTFQALGRAGRLGNQLWQVASLLDWTHRHADARAYVDTGWEYRSYLSLPDSLYLPPHGEERARDILQARPNGPYWQALPYIEEVATMLPALYALSPLAERRLHDMHGERLARMEREYTAAIHVRRTDYL